MKSKIRCQNTPHGRRETQETTAAVARVSDDRGADFDDDRARPQLQSTRRPPGNVERSRRDCARDEPVLH